MADDAERAGVRNLLVTPADVSAAAASISGSVVVTECVESRTLGEICGCRIWLKFENLQFTSSFKERGALNRLLALSEDQRRRGVIAMSAGNHAQGVAYHAKPKVAAAAGARIQHCDLSALLFAQGYARRDWVGV